MSHDDVIAGKPPQKSCCLGGVKVSALKVCQEFREIARAFSVTQWFIFGQRFLGKTKRAGRVGRKQVKVSLGKDQGIQVARLRNTTQGQKGGGYGRGAGRLVRIG